MNKNPSLHFKILKSRAFHPQTRIKTNEMPVKKRRNIGIFLLSFGVLFFLSAFILYNFDSHLPRFSSDSKVVVSPKSSIKSEADFRKALLDHGIQFESLLYATQSPTLIVKMQQDSYAYLSTTIDPSSQAKLLSSILSRVSIQEKNKKVKYIDLRFEKAVIKF